MYSRKLKLIALSFSILILISACAGAPVEVPTVIPVTKIPTPILPALSNPQKNAIDETTFLILVEREALLKAHIRLVNEIIDIHNGAIPTEDN